jgi:hypothetical protein
MPNPLTKQEQVANALIQAKGLDYGPRHHDARQQKGSGFYGALPRTDGSDSFSTELSGEANGLSFPLIYQGITEPDLRGLLSGGPLTDDLYRRAEEAARGRLALGLPAFALEGEQSPRSQIGLPPPKYGVQPRTGR